MTIVHRNPVGTHSGQTFVVEWEFYLHVCESLLIACVFVYMYGTV